MPRAALTDEQISAHRRRIVDAATALVAEHGYEAVSMRRIARELGESPMTAYRYFEGRDEIFAALRTEAYRRFADAQLAAFRASDEPMARLLALREAYIAFALREPDAYRVMFQLDQPEPCAYPELGAEGERAFDYLLRAVEAAIEAGAMQGEPLTMAHLLWAQVHGMVTLHLAGKLTLGCTLEDLRALGGAGAGVGAAVDDASDGGDAR